MNQQDTQATDTRHASAIDTVIRRRHTAKCLKSAAEARSSEQDLSFEQAQQLNEMLALAGWAPFHKKAHEATHRRGPLSSAVPWRFHVLDGRACAALLEALRDRATHQPDSIWARAWQSKIKEMLSACGALVQVTWLPDPADASTESDRPEMSRNNIEHIAATGAATQNLLLACQSRGWRSYWSSGGILREAEVFGWMGIEAQEQLLGSVFVSPPGHPCDRVIEGGLREQRGQPTQFMRWAEVQQ